MAVEILMPALSPTMEEGTLAKWLVKEGDTVKSGQILAEIETDKATMEFEAVDEGTVGKILVAEGTAGVKVNAPIAVLLEEGEDVSAAESLAAKHAASPSDAPAAPCPCRLLLPLPRRKLRLRQRLPRPLQLRLVRGFSPRRSRGGLRRRRDWTSRKFRARVRMGGSCVPMSKRPVPLRR